MIIRSKAPPRVGLAGGGGSDVSPYSDMYGGLILNVTINLYAYCMIEEIDDGMITIHAYDTHCCKIYPIAKRLEIEGEASLIKGMYNRLIEDFEFEAESFKITIYSDVPAGAELGASSTDSVLYFKGIRRVDEPTSW